jgi:hypothetical protein
MTKVKPATTSAIVATYTTKTSLKKVARKPKYYSSLRDKILEVVAKLNAPISSVSLTNYLFNWCDVEWSDTNKRRIRDTLRIMEEEKVDNFGRLYDSFYGGKESESYKNRRKLQKYHKVKSESRRRMQEIDKN